MMTTKVDDNTSRVYACDSRRTLVFIRFFEEARLLALDYDIDLDMKSIDFADSEGLILVAIHNETVDDVVYIQIGPDSDDSGGYPDDK